ncbi:MAG: DUF4139 domain-containing protein [Fretibacterium sp.]|nr:DUF4139 domain-containing protein [Fretibacterium sp.]
MKLLLLSLAALLVMLTGTAGANSSSVDLTIQAVDVYPSGAKFVFAVEPGVFDVELPGAFRAASVRLLNPNDADDFRVVEKTRKDWVPPALTELRAQLDAQQRLVSGLAARKAALEHTQELLKVVRPQDDNARDLLEYIGKSQEMKLKVENELSELDFTLKEAVEKRDRLEEEMDSRSPEEAETVLRLTGTAKAPLRIEAFTSASRWNPRYTMDLNSATGEIKTRMSARARQRTGLDYTGPITFHTKLPDEKVQTPVLRPLRVGLRPKEKPSDLRRKAAYEMMDEAMMMPEEEAMNAMMGSAAKKAPSAPVMEATLADRAVKGQGALSGDGREAEFMLGELGLKGKTRLVLIPEQRDSAWIVVGMEDIKTPLIPGTADLLVDGQPAGTTKLPEFGLGQKQIPFGYAPQITARKEPIVEKTGSSWFSGVFTGGYTLEVVNGFDQAKTITIRDCLPIPTDEKVKLEVKRIEPRPKEQDKENRLTWELEMKPHETVKLVVDYTLSYPSGEELQYRR